MKTRLLALTLLLGLGAACQSAPGQGSSHWNIESVYPRFSYYTTGYRSDRTGSFRQHQWEQKRDINRTLRRHFLNNNPDNPFQADDPNAVAPRPPHSVLPNPLMYFHLESLAVGAAFAAAGGPFLPIPIGSVIGTIEPGGWSEFTEGMGRTFSGSFGYELEQPPAPSEFRVRRR